MAYRSHYVQWAHIDELPEDDVDMIARVNVLPTRPPFREVDQTLVDQGAYLPASQENEDENALDMEVPLPPVDTEFIALAGDVDVGIHDHWASQGAWDPVELTLFTDVAAPERHVYYADPGTTGRYIYWPDAREIIPPLPRQAVADGNVWHAVRTEAGHWKMRPLTTEEFDGWDERSAAEQDEDEPDEVPPFLLAPPEPRVDIPAEQKALADYYESLLNVDLPDYALPDGADAIRREMQVFISRTNRQ
jgi:hypothetical protein